MVNRRLEKQVDNFIDKEIEKVRIDEYIRDRKDDLTEPEIERDRI